MDLYRHFVASCFPLKENKKKIQPITVRIREPASNKVIVCMWYEKEEPISLLFPFELLSGMRTESTVTKQKNFLFGT